MNSAVESYRRVLEDLQVRRSGLDAARAKLDTAIAAIEGLIEEFERVVTVPSEPANSLFIDSTQPMSQHQPYAGMTIADAAVHFLRSVKRPQKTAAIAEALRRGGLRSNAKDLYRTVYGTINNRYDKGKDFAKSGAKWGLTEWQQQQ